MTQSQDRANLVDIEVRLWYSTEKAILVSLDDEGLHKKWIPLKPCEFIYKSEKVIELTLPRRLAEEKELV